MAIELCQLRAASDYAASNDSVTINTGYNAHRGGDYPVSTHASVFAYGVTWTPRWSSNAYGDGMWVWDNADSNIFTLLLHRVAKSNATISQLAKMPIDWAASLPGYYCEVSICADYITLTDIDGNYAPRQFLHNGTDNTSAYRAQLHKAKKAKEAQTLIARGYTKKDSYAYAWAKCRWKHEQSIDKVLFLRKNQPNQAVWKALAACESRKEIGILEKKYLSADVLPRISMPRLIELCKLVAQLCEYSEPIEVAKPFPTRGNGWQLLRD